MRNFKVFSGILACFLALALVLAACDNGGGGADPGKDSTAITYTVVQTGGTASTADSTGIVFTFSASVDTLGLTAADITVGGAASKGQAALSGSGTTRTFSPITVNSAGTATIKITKTGIEAATKNVAVYKVGQATAITYTVEQTGGVGGVTTTTGIVFSFDGSVDTLGLTAADITVGGAAEKGTGVLSGTGSSRTLSPITVNEAGTATVRINKTGIETATKDLTVYKAGEGAGHTHNWGAWTDTEIAGTQERRCGSDHIEARLTGTGRFTFNVISGAAAYRVSKGTATIGSVRIPAWYRPSDENEYQPVTAIGNNGFSGCTSLIGIIIPESVAAIGSSAFSNCSSLTDVTIPAGVTSIGSSAFSGCSSLTSVTIPAGVTSIGSETFSDCTSLTGITVAENNPSYASENGILYDKAKTTLIQAPGAISGSVSIPASVTSIESYAFSGCTGLTSVTIPAGVTEIGAQAFSGCIGLTGITIPAGVTEIGAQAFFGTAWLNNQPDGLVYAGKVLYTYKGTMPANTVLNNIRADIVSIAFSAFSGCTGLTGITIPAGVTSIGSSTFSNCSSLTSVTIPAGVTSIGSSAFSRCRSLTSVTIPASVTSIGSSAFSGCTGLTGITIPAGVTSIGDSAFAWTVRLDTVTFATGSAITSANFGSGAFPQYSASPPDYTINGNNLRTAYLAGGPGTYREVRLGEGMYRWEKR